MGQNWRAKGVEFHNDRYIKSKIGIYHKKIITDFYDLRVTHDGIRCKCHAIIAIDFLFNYSFILINLVTVIINVIKIHTLLLRYMTYCDKIDLRERYWY